MRSFLPSDYQIPEYESSPASSPPKKDPSSIQNSPQKVSLSMPPEGVMSISQLSRHFQSTKKKEVQDSPADQLRQNPFQLQLTAQCEQEQASNSSMSMTVQNETAKFGSLIGSPSFAKLNDTVQTPQA